MRAIGFRAEPSAVNWAVVEGTKENPVLIAADKSEAPVAYTEPESLAWFRSRAQQLIQTYSPKSAGVRYPETMKRSSIASMDKRCRVEGILIDAMQAAGIVTSTGVLATISKNLGSSHAKKYLDTDELRGLNWASHSKNEREAIMVAASILPSGTK
jgi:hypothetical protein